MMTFPRSRVVAFYQERGLKSPQERKALRLGQAFFAFMELHKVTEPDSKVLADNLHSADDKHAVLLITSNIDWSN